MDSDSKREDSRFLMDAAVATRPEHMSARVRPRASRQRVAPTEPHRGPPSPELRHSIEVSPEDGRLALPAGYMLQEYRIERLLGIGAYGVTYLARDLMLDSPVAIKEYLPNELASRDGKSGAIYPRSMRQDEDYGNGLTRFLLQARTLAGLHHPHIVGVRGFFEANNTAYMVMDYEQGESLNTWLSRRLLRGGGAPDEALLIDMFVPLLGGLAKVHEAGILHRDIKPANVFVRAADGSLLLLDFGAARQAGGNASGEGLAGIVTPGYAPFEQYHTLGRQGPWSDLYAMGGVLYWLIAGRRPIEAAARVQNDPQQPALDAGHGRFGEDFLAAIDWALAVNEHMRPQSVAEFLAALTGDMPVSRTSLALSGDVMVAGGAAVDAGAAHQGGPPAGEVPAIASMDPKAAQVIMDAEPALVMGVEQSMESAVTPALRAPAPVGPTTVTRAEQVTVIDRGHPPPAPGELAREPRHAWFWALWAVMTVGVLLAVAWGWYAL